MVTPLAHCTGTLREWLYDVGIRTQQGFPGGSVAKNLPGDTGDVVRSLAQGRSHTRCDAAKPAGPQLAQPGLRSQKSAVKRTAKLKAAPACRNQTAARNEARHSHKQRHIIEARVLTVFIVLCQSSKKHSFLTVS